MPSRAKCKAFALWIFTMSSLEGYQKHIVKSGYYHFHLHLNDNQWSEGSDKSGGVVPLQIRKTRFEDNDPLNAKIFRCAWTKLNFIRSCLQKSTPPSTYPKTNIHTLHHEDHLEGYTAGSYLSGVS